MHGMKRPSASLTSLLLITLTATLALAADPAAPAPAATLPRPGPLMTLIPLIVPLLIAGLKAALPRIPKLYLPILAPILGLLLSLLDMGTHTGSLLAGAVLGSAGVGLREIIDQVNKERLGTPLSLLLGTLLLTGALGCVAVKQHSNIVSSTTSTIGLDISQSADGSLPHIRLGYVRAQFHVVPTVRNSNEWIHAPAMVSSMNLESKPSTQSIQEDFATGDAVRWLADTDTVARQAIAAKTNQLALPKP